MYKKCGLLVLLGVLLVTTSCEPGCGSGDFFTFGLTGNSACTMDPFAAEVPVDGIFSTQQRIFVTSSAMPNGTLDGNVTTGASKGDTICASSAAAATTPLVKTYKAILSDGTDSALSRITLKTGELVKIAMDGIVTNVLGSASDLWDSAVDRLSVINLDENGADIGSVSVWTGSTAAGASAADHCTDWSSTSLLIDGQKGSTAFTDSNWIDTGFQACNETTFHLYCISTN